MRECFFCIQEVDAFDCKSDVQRRLIAVKGTGVGTLPDVLGTIDALVAEAHEHPDSAPLSEIASSNMSRRSRVHHMVDAYAWLRIAHD
ncbi:MAG: hypothetical protein ACT4O1_07260 [Gemmatimonadota bacterium]